MARYSSCLGVLPSLAERVLQLRAGAGGTRPSSRQQVAQRLHIGVGHEVHLETSGLNELAAVGSAGGCSNGVIVVPAQNHLVASPVLVNVGAVPTFASSSLTGGSSRGPATRSTTGAGAASAVLSATAQRTPGVPRPAAAHVSTSSIPAAAVVLAALVLLGAAALASPAGRRVIAREQLLLAGAGPLARSRRGNASAEDADAAGGAAGVVAAASSGAAGGEADEARQQWLPPEAESGEQGSGGEPASSPSGATWLPSGDESSPAADEATSVGEEAPAASAGAGWVPGAAAGAAAAESQAPDVQSGAPTGGSTWMQSHRPQLAVAATAVAGALRLLARRRRRR